MATIGKGAHPSPRPPLPPPLPLPRLTSATTTQTADGALESQSESLLTCQRLFDNEKFYGERCHLVSYYHRVSPVMQEGPSCGLAALCMGCQLLDVKPVRALPEVLQAARSLGLTCRGEMFSVANMCVLARELMSVQAELLTDGLDQRRRIVQHLASGRPVLVPYFSPVSYDADLNHEPSCRHGHKAHWAVLTGVVFVVPHESAVQMRTSFTRDVSFPLLFHVKDDDHCLDWLPTAGNGDIDCRVYVYTRQGKSSHPSLWFYDSLAKSNANLTELSPLRRRSIDGYVLPVDGVEGGLCRQIVLLHAS